MNKYFWITEDPIDLNDVYEKVVRSQAGAVSTFTGIVREFTHGKRTLFLEYQAYRSMAEKQLAKIGEEIDERWKDTQVAIVHRIGRLEISEIAVAIAVSTPHREDSFAACRYAIERIKEMVPIWKKEHWEDGSVWIGDQQEKISYKDKVPPLEEMNDD